MAKIPEAALKTIRTRSGEIRDLAEEIISLSNDVNTDTFVVGTFEFEFTEEQRDRIIARYNEIKTTLQSTIASLP